MTASNEAGGAGSGRSGGGRRKAKKAYVAMPQVEGILLSLTAVAIVYSGYALWVTKQSEFFLWLVCLVACEGVVWLSRRFWAWFGLSVSHLLVSWGVADKPPISNHESMTKWLEQSWQLTIHFFFACVEYYMLFIAERNPVTLPRMWEWEDTVNQWVPRPWEGQAQDWRVRLIYVAQLAVWMYTAGMHVFYDKRRKDYQVMLTHHVVTIVLIAGSLHFNFFRIGFCVLFLNDAADIFVDWLKMANYLKLRGPRALFFGEGSFVLMMVTFAYFRGYIAPLRVHYGGLSLWDCTPAQQAAGECGPVPSSGYWAVRFLVGLLYVLTCIHLYWLALMIRILFVIVTKDAQSASREEYEGDSDEEDDGSPTEKYLFSTTLLSFASKSEKTA